MVNERLVYLKKCQYGASQPQDHAYIFGLRMIPVDRSEGYEPEQARRLVASWNACVDMPIEAVESDAVAGLLAALINLTAEGENIRCGKKPDGALGAALADARAAIAKATLTPGEVSG